MAGEKGCLNQVHAPIRTDGLQTVLLMASAELFALLDARRRARVGQQHAAPLCGHHLPNARALTEFEQGLTQYVTARRTSARISG
jgi:hypothetical protein